MAVDRVLLLMVLQDVAVAVKGDCFGRFFVDIVIWVGEWGRFGLWKSCIILNQVPSL